MDEWDAVVIGGGPAGLSAAMWLARYRRRTLVFDSGQYRNRWASEMHGYLGFDRADPAELRKRALDDLSHYATVERREDRVSSARSDGDRFEVGVDGDVVACRRVVIATGVRDAVPAVGGFFEHYGTSVFNCPVCDGYEARGKRVVVFGWDEDVVAFSRHLLEWASRVTIVTNGARFEASEEEADELPALDVREENAVELVGERGDLRGVRLDGGDVLEADMAFITIDQQPASELAVELGCEVNDEGCVIVDDRGRTSVDGVYAAGDILPGPDLVQLAAASGALAGLACARSLRGRRAVGRR